MPMMYRQGFLTALNLGSGFGCLVSANWIPAAYFLVACTFFVWLDWQRQWFSATTEQARRSEIPCAPTGRRKAGAL